MNSGPAITSASLLASSTRLPARAAASVGAQPGRADDRGHDDINLGMRRDLDQTLIAGQHLDPQPPARSAACNARGRSMSATTANAGAARGTAPATRPARVGGERKHRDNARVARNHIEGAGADGTGGTEHSDRLRHRH